MTKHRNCPNCGAPYEIGENRCQYCGTAYFDMSTIDFDSHEKFFLTIKHNGMLITQLVEPSTAEFQTDSDVVYARGGKQNEKIASFVRSTSLNTNVSFRAVVDNKGVLATIKRNE